MLGAVLAGGQSRRLPFVKGLMAFRGRRLIDHPIGVLKGAAGDVVVSANAPELYFRLGVPVIGDVMKPSGPLAGIFSVLLATGADEVFVAACDMPFVDERLVCFIMSRHAGDATVPVFNGRAEPLLAVYSQGIMKAAEHMLDRGEASLTKGGSSLLSRINVNYVHEKDVRKIDPEGRSFSNINTLEDSERLWSEAFEGGRACSV